MRSFSRETKHHCTFPQALWLYLWEFWQVIHMTQEKREEMFLPTTLQPSVLLRETVWHTDKNIRSEEHTKKWMILLPSRKQQKSLSTQFQPQVDFSEFGPICHKLLAGSELGSFRKSDGNSSSFRCFSVVTHIYISYNVHRVSHKHRVCNPCAINC